MLRVPRNCQAQPSALPVSAAGKSPTTGPPDTALGVDGIELREQTHEEALLNTIGEQPFPSKPCLQSLSKSVKLTPCCASLS